MIDPTVITVADGTAWRRSAIACRLPSLQLCNQSFVISLGVAHHRHRSIRVGDGRRSAGAVDHVQDASRASRREEDGQQIVKACR